MLLVVIVGRRWWWRRRQRTSSHPGMIVVMVMVMVQLGRRLFRLQLHFAIDILERVANQHRSVQRLLRHLTEARQLKHGQVAHFQAAIAIALFVGAPTVATIATTALRWRRSCGMNGTRIDRNGRGGHWRVIAAAQLQVGLAVLGTPNGLLRMRMRGLGWHIVAAVVAAAPAVVASRWLARVLRWCSRAVLLRIRLGIVAGLAVPRRRCGRRHVVVAGCVCSTIAAGWRRCAWIAHWRVAGDDALLLVKVVLKVLVVVVEVVRVHEGGGER